MGRTIATDDRDVVDDDDDQGTMPPVLGDDEVVVSGLGEIRWSAEPGKLVQRSRSMMGSFWLV